MLQLTVFQPINLRARDVESVEKMRQDDSLAAVARSQMEVTERRSRLEALERELTVRELDLAEHTRAFQTKSLTWEQQHKHKQQDLDSATEQLERQRSVRTTI